jgi:CBS domain-containing protein
VETAEINHRVADFLKRHPPFNVVDDGDLLAFAGHGRVRFHEPHDYILWQGEPHRHQVFVIQQGTVSLWDEAGGRGVLRDVRGPGDMLGLERYNGLSRSPYSARSESDVVIYAFPADDFSQYVLKYERAAQYVETDAHVVAEAGATGLGSQPHLTPLSSLAEHQTLTTCRSTDTIASSVARLLRERSGVLAVLGDDDGVVSALSAEAILRWVASGAGDAHVSIVDQLTTELPSMVSTDATVSDGILSASGSAGHIVAITSDGTRAGQLQALVTRSDFARFFGEQPGELLGEIALARDCRELADLNRRLRASVFEHLTGPLTVGWLARLTSLGDAAIASRVQALEVPSQIGCWCLCGASGRGESLTAVIPSVVVLVGEDDDEQLAVEQHRHLVGRLADCGYLPRDLPFETRFYVATVSEWTRRYRGWVSDPVRQQMSRARTLFDLRPLGGRRELFDQLHAAVSAAIDRDFLHVLANDCLANVPPLTFYQDAVVDNVGERDSTFQLVETALRPLVDVGRVFGMAGGAIFGRSTLDRLAVAAALLPDHDELFKEASDAFRVVLCQQGRIGIRDNTAGYELSPALFSRDDRHVLKSSFRSIYRLLQFTADPEWLQKV